MSFLYALTLMHSIFEYLENLHIISLVLLNVYRYYVLIFLKSSNSFVKFF